MRWVGHAKEDSRVAPQHPVFSPSDIILREQLFAQLVARHQLITLVGVWYAYGCAWRLAGWSTRPTKEVPFYLPLIIGLDNEPALFKKITHIAQGATSQETKQK